MGASMPSEEACVARTSAQDGDRLAVRRQNLIAANAAG